LKVLRTFAANRGEVPCYPNDFVEVGIGSGCALAGSVKRDDQNGIDERSFRFFCEVLAFVESIPSEPKTVRIIARTKPPAGCASVQPDAWAHTTSAWWSWTNAANGHASSARSWLPQRAGTKP